MFVVIMLTRKETFMRIWERWRELKYENGS